MWEERVMPPNEPLPLRELDEDAALRSILEGTATKTGEGFFAALVEKLAKTLNTEGAWVTEYVAESRRLRTLAAWMGGRFLSNYEYEILGTPCEQVIDEARLIHFRENVAEFFPDDSELKDIGAVSYMGVPLMDLDGKILGNLAVLDRRPMPEEPRGLAVFRIFAARAAAELQRLRAESEVRKSEEKYRRIVETTGEGFLLLDRNLNITDVNNAYCQMIGYRCDEIMGKRVIDFFTEEYRQIFIAQKDKLESKEYREFESTAVAKDGRHIPVLVHSNTLRDDKGTVIGNMAFVTDMTEHKKSLALAGEVQKSLLPQHGLRFDGLEIAGRSLSCEEIGGDYFDYLWGEEYSNNPFSVVVGDITGHGVDAALLMTTARAFLRMRASQSGSISQIVNELNHHLARDILDSGRFMTLFYLTIDRNSRNLRWVRAGHDPAIVYDPSHDRFEELKGEGLALGVNDTFSYEENLRTGMVEGQIIAVGTDGIWETRNKDGAMYGKDRLKKILRREANEGAEVILNAVYDDITLFTRGMRIEDDITLVVVKVVGDPEK